MVHKSSQNSFVSEEFAKQKKIAIVVSRFNEEICTGLLHGAQKTLNELGVSSDGVKVFYVPGAFEIPLVAKKIAQSKNYDGVVALGCVIKGDTAHFEFVSLAATMGVLEAGLQTEVPVSFGVITVNNQEQAITRSRDDDYNKGREASLALLDVLQTLEQV